MKLTAFLLLVATLQVSAAGYSQKVTLTRQQVPLVQVFKEIERQTGYLFLYEENLLSQTRNVSIKATAMPLKEALDICMKEQPLEYTIIQHTVVIKEKAAVKKLAELLFAPPPPAKNLSGVVWDGKGKPVEGAVLTIKSLRKSTVSDQQGRYSFSEIPAGTYTVEITLIGYETQSRTVTVKAGEVAAATIYLKESSNVLDETVIIAYGTTTRRFNTGSVASVTAADIAKQPVGNVLQALQGRIAGLEVNQASGIASGNMNLQIRGRKELLSDINRYDYYSEPLYVIDGVPLMNSFGNTTFGGLIQNGLTGPAGGQSPLFSINPADVESVEVLKDADATSIYGSRGANGVILITTKKAKPGKSTFNINAYTGFTTRTRKAKLLNTQQYLEMRREAFKNDNITPTDDNAPDLRLWDQNREVDWQKELSANSHTYDLQLSYSGGDINNTYRLSGGYHKQTPPIPVSMPQGFKDDRFSTQLSFTHYSPDRRFTATTTVNFSVVNSNLPGSSFANFSLPPNAPPLLNAQGKLNWEQYGSKFLDTYAPLFQPYKATTNNLVGNLALSYKIYKGLAVSASIGYNDTRMDQVSLKPRSSMDPTRSNVNTAQFGTNNFRTWIFEPNISYNSRIGKGQLQLLLGSTLQNFNTHNSRLTAGGFTNEAIMENLGAATSITGQSEDAQYKYSGAFARATFNYDAKYVLNVSARRDASSRFSPGNQVGNFASAGAAWLFTEEKWLKNKTGFLSFGKLRASYGTAGSAPGGDYAYYNQWSFTGSYDGVSNLAMISSGNSNYHWQVNKKIEAAIELGLLKDKITLSIAWYQERCNNQLVKYPLPVFLSPFPTTQNIAAHVQNRGWEFTVATNNVKTKNFSWSSAFNLSINRNKLLAFPDMQNTTYRDVYVIGQPLSIQKTLHFTGVDPKTGKFSFLDANGNGSISAYGVSNDKVGLLNFAPPFFGGIQNNFQYKGIQLSFMIDFKKQKGPFGMVLGTPGSLLNQPVAALGRWQKEGDVTNIAKFTTLSTAEQSNYNSSDAQIVNASYARLQNVSVAYNLPLQWVSRAKMSAVRIYAQTQNLLTISNYPGVDPTSPTINYSFPPQRFFTGGIQITF